MLGDRGRCLRQVWMKDEMTLGWRGLVMRATRDQFNNSCIIFMFRSVSSNSLRKTAMMLKPQYLMASSYRNLELKKENCQGQFLSMQ